MEYKITGTLANGKRFAPIITTNRIYAEGINLFNGSKWQRRTGTKSWRLVVRVVN